MSYYRFEEVTGKDINISAENLRLTRRFRGIDKLPQSVGGDYFDFMAGAALSTIQAMYPTYSTPYGTLYWNEIQVHENHYALNYDITVSYTPYERAAGAYQISVDTTGGTVTAREGKVIGKFGADAPASVDDCSPLIGVIGEEVSGIEIPVETTKIVVNFRHPQMYLNRSYIRATGKLVGYPNSDTFLGYEPGEVRYAGGNFTESNTEASATYNFEISYNVTGIEVAGITGIDKKGWDVLDPVYEDSEEATEIIKKVKYFKTIRPAGREWKAYSSVFGWGA